ncbi:MAG: PadR family transcriptional regulator [Clostridia bacterium]|nr:PadR family transcriptional regulator [Clostridia bacterium]
MGRTVNKDSGHSFEDYFKRATSPMMTLLLLNEKPMYVYKLSQELERRSNSTYKMNFLYPVLYRLQQQGYVTEYSQEITESHRTRNYYAITDEGREYLDYMLAKYRELLKAVDTIIEGKGDIDTTMPTDSGFDGEESF